MADQSSSSLYFHDDNKRPLWRGKIHEYAFYVTLGLLPMTLYMLRDWRTHSIPLIVYFMSILGQYAVSGYYNQKIWHCPLIERKWQQLDHSCIFLLISGSYTAQISIVWDDMDSGYILLAIIWILAILGVMKTIFLSAMPAIINTLVYIGMGCACVPWLGSIAESVHIRDLILMIIGGLFYAIGGLIFALRSPNPFPKIFGSHEIFHVCTVVAQVCFFIPVLLVI